MLTISQIGVNSEAGRWEDWITRECHKRVLCATLILSNILTAVYDTNPGLLTFEDLDFEMSNHESLWNAKDEQHWQDLRDAYGISNNGKTLKDVLADIMSMEQDEDPKIHNKYHLSAFPALVVVHAVCTQMWTCDHLVRTLGCPPLRGARDDGSGHLRELLRSRSISILTRCQRMLSCSEGREDGAEEEPSWDHPDGPLLFNCQAALRIAYARLFVPSKPFHRLVLITSDGCTIDEAAQAYAASPQERSSLFAQAAAKAAQGFLTPVQIGHMLVRKTAALSWSVEHAIAGWDCALFVTKWIHTVEMQSKNAKPTAQEQSIMAQLRESLYEMEFEYEEGTSLAATVARAWAMFLTDVWVWGVTPKMGLCLERLAAAYQKAFDASSAA